jgi:hypothetical protein
METHEPRLFADDAAVRHVGEGMMARTLPKAEWTHEAHLGTCAWILLERPDLVPERDLPDLIRAYNVSVGGVNDESQGYHETITQAFVRGVRLSLAASEGQSGLADRVNALLRSPQGQRDWPLGFYGRERLLSVEARMGWIEPDLAPLPAAPTCAMRR